MLKWRRAEGTPPRVLDFDLETLAAGFDDPQWVPHKITCVAWSWVGEKPVYAQSCGPLGFFTSPERRRGMLDPFLVELRSADLVTGHNIIRHDLPILNAECLRLGLEPLPDLKVQDTMRIVKTKGFKKGQDNLGVLLQTLERKLALNWQEWQHAYEETGWPVVKERCASDVRMHKEIREKMLANGWLKPATVWRP